MRNLHYHLTQEETFEKCKNLWTLKDTKKTDSSTTARFNIFRSIDTITIRAFLKLSLFEHIQSCRNPDLLAPAKSKQALKLQTFRTNLKILFHPLPQTRRILQKQGLKQRERLCLERSNLDTILFCLSLKKLLLGLGADTVPLQKPFCPDGKLWGT